MQKTLMLSVSLALSALAPAAVKVDPKHQPAVDAAKTWCALVDKGAYPASHAAAAAYFRKALSADQWAQAAAAARQPLGALKARTLKSVSHHTNLPGAPDGEYVVVQFDTVFENKAKAVETVTPMKEKDGSWKVSGYFIK